MYCSNCGRKLLDDSMFCTSCGSPQFVQKKLSDISSLQETTVNRTKGINGKEKQKKIGKRVLVAVAIVIVIAFCCTVNCVGMLCFKGWSDIYPITIFAETEQEWSKAIENRGIDTFKMMTVAYDRGKSEVVSLSDEEISAFMRMCNSMPKEVTESLVFAYWVYLWQAINEEDYNSVKEAMENLGLEEKLKALEVAEAAGCDEKEILSMLKESEWVKQSSIKLLVLFGFEEDEFSAMSSSEIMTFLCQWVDAIDDVSNEMENMIVYSSDDSLSSNRIFMVEGDIYRVVGIIKPVIEVNCNIEDAVLHIAGQEIDLSTNGKQVSLLPGCYEYSVSYKAQDGETEIRTDTKMMMVSYEENVLDIQIEK